MFEVGDKVRFLDEPGNGEIVSINGNEAVVLNESGFEEVYSLSHLVPHKSLSVDTVSVKDFTASKATFTNSKIGINLLEVDLHFAQLVDYPKNYTAHQKLTIQLNEAKKAIDKAKRGGIKKIILIHGVGQGRLKEEIHTLLERMDNLTFYDASFASYGAGATEVELFGR